MESDRPARQQTWLLVQLLLCVLSNQAANVHRIAIVFYCTIDRVEVVRG